MNGAGIQVSFVFFLYIVLFEATNVRANASQSCLNATKSYESACNTELANESR